MKLIKGNKTIRDLTLLTVLAFVCTLLLIAGRTLYASTTSEPVSAERILAVCGPGEIYTSLELNSSNHNNEGNTCAHQFGTAIIGQVNTKRRKMNTC